MGLLGQLARDLWAGIEVVAVWLADRYEAIPAQDRSRAFRFLGRLAVVFIVGYILYEYGLSYAIAALPLVIVVTGLGVILGRRDPIWVLGPIGRWLGGAITGAWRWLFGIRPPRQRN